MSAPAPVRPRVAPPRTAPPRTAPPRTAPPRPRTAAPKAKAAPKKQPAQPQPTDTRTSVLRLLPSPRGSHAARTPFVLLILGMLAAGLAGLLMLNTVIDQDAFHLAKLQDNQSSLDIQEAQLHESVNSDADPAVLASKAAALGMVPAGSPEFVREAKLPKGTRVGNLIVTGTAVTPAPTPSAAAATALPSAQASASVQPSAQASTAPVVTAKSTSKTTGHTTVTKKTTTTRSSNGSTTTTTTTTTTTSGGKP